MFNNIKIFISNMLFLAKVKKRTPLKDNTTFPLNEQEKRLLVHTLESMKEGERFPFYLLNSKGERWGEDLHYSKEKDHFYTSCWASEEYIIYSLEQTKNIILHELRRQKNEITKLDSYIDMIKSIEL